MITELSLQGEVNGLRLLLTAMLVGQAQSADDPDGALAAFQKAMDNSVNLMNLSGDAYAANEEIREHMRALVKGILDECRANVAKPNPPYQKQ